MPHPAASNASRQKWSTRGRKRRAVTVESPEDIVECAETENEEKKRVRWDSEVDERPAEDGESTDEEDASKSKSDKVRVVASVMRDLATNALADMRDQIKPGILTSSKTDDGFMDVLRSASERFSTFCITYTDVQADAEGVIRSNLATSR
ncbi:hypothetical protein NEOLEDRAFT_130188 [Neolentinus lepideus HHB14362 ss-1]|uniref:Uncharacterized protein n=1 Tax=Neolentinus lepideus HHB14362 ss-1 TaxID=1314782 RepID=A0A165MQA0_9AGAM|nr:hypothetical protein NEOLEDRAFT_130188 [Neolentinus lepideus HHB14362 ss-1]